MTDLTKPVKRRADATYFSQGTRRILVTLYPRNGAQSERIGFRLERTRKEYTADLAGVFQHVMMGSINSERAKIERRAKELNKTGIPLRTARKQAREELK